MPASTVIQPMQFCVVSVPPSCTTANCWVFGVTERLAGAPPCCWPTGGGDACAPYFAELLCVFEPISGALLCCARACNRLICSSADGPAVLAGSECDLTGAETRLCAGTLVPASLPALAVPPLPRRQKTKSPNAWPEFRIRLYCGTWSDRPATPGWMNR